MKVHIVVDNDSGLIHSLATTANVHDLSQAARLLHVEAEVEHADAGYQGIAKRLEMAGKSIMFCVAMLPGKRRAHADKPDGSLQDLIEVDKALISAKGEHPFLVIKQQFGFQKTRLRSMAKSRFKVKALASVTNLILTRC